MSKKMRLSKDRKKMEMRNIPNTNQVSSSTDEVPAPQLKSRTDPPEENRKVLRRSRRIAEQRRRRKDANI